MSTGRSLSITSGSASRRQTRPAPSRETTRNNHFFFVAHSTKTGHLSTGRSLVLTRTRARARTRERPFLFTHRKSKLPGDGRDGEVWAASLTRLRSRPYPLLLFLPFRRKFFLNRMASIASSIPPSAWCIRHMVPTCEVKPRHNRDARIPLGTPRPSCACSAWSGDERLANSAPSLPLRWVVY